MFCFARAKDNTLKVDAYVRKFKCQGAFSNDRGSIWPYWKNAINIASLSHSDQHITAQIIQRRYSVMVTSVYASCDPVKRRDLWSDLSQHIQAGPWLISGDFNIVSAQDEKLGGNPVSFQDVYEFNQMIVCNGLSDAGYSRNKYTWSNNRLQSARILERLDNVLLNTN